MGEVAARFDLIRERWEPARPEGLWPPIDDAARIGWFAFAGRMEVRLQPGNGHATRCKAEMGASHGKAPGGAARPEGPRARDHPRQAVGIP